MQASQIFEIVIVTLIFSDVVPQLNYASHTLSGMGTSLLPYFTFITLFSFQGADIVEANSISLALAFCQNSLISLLLLFLANPFHWASLGFGTIFISSPF
jgi:hypothetical protein